MFFLIKLSLFISILFLDQSSRTNLEPIPQARLVTQPFTAFSSDPKTLFTPQTVATSSRSSAAPIRPQLPSQQRAATRSFIGPQLPPQQVQAAVEAQPQEQQSFVNKEQTGENIIFNCSIFLDFAILDKHHNCYLNF